MVAKEKIKEVYKGIVVEKVDANNGDTSPFWTIQEDTVTTLRNFFEGQDLDPVDAITVEERVSSDKRAWISTGYKGIKAPKGAKDGDVFTKIAKATASRPYAQAGINRGDVVAILVK